MGDSFDPYYKWLGIPPQEQPPNHYRLLAINLFESDSDVIEAAADRQMSHLRSYQTGKHSGHSQKLLNECAAARVTLLNPEKKADYDRQLREELARERTPASSVPRAKPVSQLQSSPATPSAPFIDVGASSPAVRLSVRRRNKNSPWLLPAAGVGGAIALALVIWIALRPSGRSEPEETPTLANNGPRKSAPAAPVVDKAMPEPRAAAPQPKLQIIEAQWGAGESWQDVTERVQSLVHEERLLATTSGLFPGEPDSASGAPKLLRIRYHAAEEAGMAEFGEQDIIYLDGHPASSREPSTEGLQVLDARYGAGSTWIDVSPRLRRWVHGDRLAVRVDRLAQSDAEPNVRKTLFLRYRTSDGEFVAHAWDGEELILDARPVATAGKRTDLIAVADPDRDSAGGRWDKDGSTLVGPNNEPGNLTIRSPLTRDYLLTAVVEQTPRPNNVGITLPIGDRQVQLVVDGWPSNSISALQLIDGAMGDGNPTTRHGTFCEPGQATIIQCAVRESSVYVTCNGRVAVDWRGDANRLSALDETAASERSSIVLRGLGIPWRVSRLEVASLAAQPSSPVSTASEVVDLLKLIDPQLDAVSGEWQMSGEGLLTPIGEFVRLGVPYLPPDDYELRVVAARQKGHDLFSIGLIVDGRQTEVVLDGWTGTMRGLAGLDGEWYEPNATTKEGAVFVDERPKELTCTVHPTSVHVASEGQTLIDWHGDARRFSSKTDVPDQLGLQLCDWNTRFLISKFELRPLPPAKPEPPADLARPIDLLSRIDLNRDVVQGKWKKEGSALVAEAGQNSRLQLPVLPPEEYTLTIEALGNRDVDFGIVVGGRQVDVVMGGFGGDVSGLQLVNGQGFDRNPTTHHGKVLRDDGSNTIVCDVRKNQVEIACNGKPVIDWQGDPRSLSPFPGLTLPDDRRLYVRPWDVPYRITRLELSAVGATQPPESGSKSEQPRSGRLSMLGNQPRLPVPDDNAQRKARLELQKTIASKLAAAKSPAAKRALAEELIREAAAAKTPDAHLYVMLDQAIDLAESADDLDLAWQAIDELAAMFKVDALPRRQQSLTTVGKAARSPQQYGELADAASLLLSQALAVEDAAVVKKVAAQAQSFAKRTKDISFTKSVSARAQDASKLAGQIDDVTQARETLKTKPDDELANFTVGYYELCGAGDREHALPKLAKSADTDWKKIAQEDVDASRNVVTAQKQLALADAWLARAENESWPGRHYLRMRAGEWYRGVLGSLPSDERRHCSERLKELLADDDGLPAWELFELNRADKRGTYERIEAGGSLRTCVEYEGPVDITFVARTDSLNLRLFAHGHGVVIWNWEANTSELRVHRPDDVAVGAPVTPLEPNRWYTLRYRITPQGTNVSVDGWSVFTENHVYGKFPRSPVGLDGHGPAVIDVKKFVVRPVE